MLFRSALPICLGRCVVSYDTQAGCGRSYVITLARVGACPGGFGGFLLTIKEPPVTQNGLETSASHSWARQVYRNVTLRCITCRPRHRRALQTDSRYLPLRVGSGHPACPSMQPLSHSISISISIANVQTFQSSCIQLLSCGYGHTQYVLSVSELRGKHTYTAYVNVELTRI